MRSKLMLLLSIAVLLIVAHGEARAVCRPSPTRVCVTHNGSVFMLNTGSGYVSKPVLPAASNRALTFELESP